MEKITEAESLYYQCCDRIDENLEVAEPFLVNCISFVKRETQGKSSRQIIREEIGYGLFIPYVREMTYIANLDDRLFKSLMVSALDFSVVLQQVRLIYKYSRDSDFETVSPSTHRNKARMAADLLVILSNEMKPSVKPRQASIPEFEI